MKKALLTAAAASVVVLAGYSGTAEARCYRIGHHWSCGHHRLHYGHRLHYRSWALGHTRAYPAWGYGYGSSYGPAYSYGGGYGSYQSSGGMGPAPSSDKH